jgi:hypothetical protein
MLVQREQTRGATISSLPLVPGTVCAAAPCVGPASERPENRRADRAEARLRFLTKARHTYNKGDRRIEPLAVA